MIDRRLAAFLLGAAQRIPPGAPERPPGAFVVLCLGDSFTYGNGAPRDLSYPRQLEGLLNEGGGRRRFVVVNGGVPGHNTSQILATLEARLETVRPDLVILLAGMANPWNLRGYHSFRSGRTWSAALLDGLYRVRTFKLAKLLWRDLRRPAARPLPAAAAERIRRANALARECDGLSDRGVFAKAAGCYGRVVALNPADVRAYHGLGVSLTHAGRHREAVSAFMSGVEADPGSPDNVNYGVLVGLCFSREGPDARREIVGFFEKLRERFPEAALPRQVLALVRDEEVRAEDIAAWMEGDLERIVAVCRGRGVAVLMQSYPLQADLRNKDFAARISVPFVDHTEAFGRVISEGRRGEYLVFDGHCSARGYGLMAEGLRRKMAELGMLRERPVR
ncbi:MAG: hypothetical protein HY926_04225 [Elusimicrobia bacterium]|nr:hypothetical protein [Elusimicrobiota bacterium]